MKYMFLIFGHADAETVPRDAPCLVFGDTARQMPNFVTSHALRPPETARTVSVRDGSAVVTDGPFIDTKEQLGGYFVMELPDREAALEFAATIPGASDGHVEVRALVDFD